MPDSLLFAEENSSPAPKQEVTATEVLSAAELIAKLERLHLLLMAKQTAWQAKLTTLEAENQDLMQLHTVVDTQQEDLAQLQATVQQLQQENQHLQEELFFTKNQLLDANREQEQQLHTHNLEANLEDNYEYKRLLQEKQILETKNKILQREKENLSDEKQVVLQQLEVLAAEKENLWQKNLAQTKSLATIEHQQEKIAELKLKLLDFLAASRQKIATLKELIKEEL